MSLGEALGTDGADGAKGAAAGPTAWAVRVQHKPLVRWVWFGAMLMAFGGTFALFDKRYRRLAAKERESGARQVVHSPASTADLELDSGRV